MKTLEVQRFIREKPGDWEALLSSPPYCLEIKRDSVFGRKLVLFKYNQIESDFSLPVVRECRGLVLDEERDFEVVVFPFVKFFNYNEPFADRIDWNTAKITQKLDGSLGKVVKMSGERVLIGTNSTIDAFKAPLADQVGCKARNFGDLFMEGLAYYGLGEKSFAEMLDYDKTYIFELTSPYNQVVVRWPETKVNFIGVRDNLTFLEEKYENHELSKVFETPKIYPLRDMEECLRETEKMGDNEEGFVVRDGDFHRIKIKSAEYIRLHRLAGNGILSFERAVEIVKMNEIEEIASYFPHFRKTLEDVKGRFETLKTSLEVSWDGFMTLVTPLAPRKEAAMWIKKNFSIPGCGFALLDGKVSSVGEFLGRMPSRTLVKMLGYKSIEKEEK